MKKAVSYNILFCFFTKDVRPFMQPTIDGAPYVQIPTHDVYDICYLDK